MIGLHKILKCRAITLIANISLNPLVTGRPIEGPYLPTGEDDTMSLNAITEWSDYNNGLMLICSVIGSCHKYLRQKPDLRCSPHPPTLSQLQWEHLTFNYLWSTAFESLHGVMDENKQTPSRSRLMQNPGGHNSKKGQLWPSSSSPKVMIRYPRRLP